jgi:hypothetical protein
MVTMRGRLKLWLCCMFMHVSRVLPLRNSLQVPRGGKYRGNSGT